MLTVDTPVPGTKYDVDDGAFGDLTGSTASTTPRPCEAAPPARSTPRTSSGDDIAWLADLTGLPVVVKGVLRPDDAERCVQAGARGVWVSNHGGRQLDRAVATSTALPVVAARVGGDAEVYVDGGIRSGLDVLTALALGADAVFCGRTPLLALAAGGEERVVSTLAALRHETVDAMRLAGCRTLADTRSLTGPERPTPL